MADPTPEAAEAPKKSGGGIVGLLINGIGIFALCTGAVVVGGMVNAKLHPPQRLKMEKGQLMLADPGEVETHAAPPKPALYYAFDPPFVVNFDDAEAVRFLQLQVQVMGRDQPVLDAVKLNDPMIRNALLLLLNGRDYKQLMTREGKEALRLECLKTVQDILEKETGRAGIEDLFFTSFVVQ
jgi:flagellar FliL protein